MTNNEIINTNDVAETAREREDGSTDVRTDMVATHEAEGKGIEFHVSMRDYTLRDMEALIVEAAAMQIVGKFADNRLAKAIEAKCILLLDAKAETALSSVTTEIIDQPLTPSWGDNKPVTMREFIGLTGREYLSQTVDTDGKPTARDSWNRSRVMTRIEHIVMTIMTREFKTEIDRATAAMVRQVQDDIKKAHATILEEHKARLREALTKVVSP